MSFHEILFPADISYGSSGGPGFKTTVFVADSGYEQRNIDWRNVRCEYDVSQAIKQQDQMDALTAFFMARRGKAYGFRFKDWNDFRIALQQIAVGDGATKTFQIAKSYTSASDDSGESYTYVRPIRKIAWGTVAGVSVGGVVKTSPSDYSVDYNTGLITFVTAPADAAAIVIGAAEFHVPVRFDIDKLTVTQEFWNTSSWPNINLVEVRDWSDVVQ